MKTVSGVTPPASIAAAAVMTLLVLPGSKPSCTTAVAQVASRGRRSRSPGRTVGAVAIARICPVRGSMTMTLPLCAPVAFTCLAIASWAFHWMSRSRVSRRPLPGIGLLCSSSPIGMRWPSR